MRTSGRRSRANGMRLTAQDPNCTYDGSEYLSEAVRLRTNVEFRHEGCLVPCLGMYCHGDVCLGSACEVDDLLDANGEAAVGTGASCQWGDEYIVTVTFGTGEIV